MIAAGICLIAFGAHTYVAPAIYQEYLRQQYLASPEVASSVNHAGPVRKAFPQEAVARLRFTRLRQDFFVLRDEGTNLSKGPVWLPATSPPGTVGNVIFAAHRDTHFRFLKDIRIGDIFRVDSPQGDLTYKVIKTHIVNKDNVKLLAPQASAMLTLVTCYPFFYIGNAPQRFIVRAELVKQE